MPSAGLSVCLSQTEYLLKWRNYDDEDNTWEPEEHLGCPELIRAFEESRQKKKDEERRKDVDKDVSSIHIKKKFVTLFSSKVNFGCLLLLCACMCVHCKRH